MKGNAMLTLSLLVGTICSAQNLPSRLEAYKLDIPPKIDGVLDDACWRQSAIGTGFTEFSPSPGDTPDQETQVQVAYDDVAIYLALRMLDDQPELILTELSERDAGPNNADYVWFAFDTYHDGQHAFTFGLSASGVQSDMRQANEQHDFLWSAVWTSAVKIDSLGWVAEVRVPYSALRFPALPEQSWGFQVERNVRRTRETSTWSPRNPEQGNEIVEFGDLTGLLNIKPPIRLALTPYVSASAEHFPFDVSGQSNWSRSFRAGMDLKYGINEAFTLDLTLVPDFGQVRSDNQVLNLSPFEVQFDEHRSFFTEGTELFQKGNLFYTRRIGGRPIGFFAVQPDSNEQLLQNPTESQLLNATKITGRTSSGLGIGVFNAITDEASATIRQADGVVRHVETQPLTNYNVVVLDQSLKNNSSVTLVNTNVLRAGHWEDANSSALLFNLRDSANRFAISVTGKVSQNHIGIDDSGRYSSELGSAYGLTLAKVSGQLTYGITRWVETDRYDPNDLGILFANNEVNHNAYIRFNQYKPVWKFINFGQTLDLSYQRLFRPSVFTGFYLNYNSWYTLTNYLTFGLNAHTQLGDRRDYFEPRTPGRYYATPNSIGASFFFSPDYRKRFIVDGNGGAGVTPETGGFSYQFGLRPRFRVNDKLTLRHDFSRSINRGNFGFVAIDGANIRFAERSQFVISNVLNVTYIANPKLSGAFRLRHYWSRADHTGVYHLNMDGTLTLAPTGLPQSEEDALYDINFNAFNIDLAIRWEFSPGSELLVTWKNEILRANQAVDQAFLKNLGRTIADDQSNTLSLKLLYYLDYANIFPPSSKVRE